MTLSKKLILSFIFSILVSILIISFISNTMINHKFDIYLIEEQNKKFESIRKDINEIYIAKGNNITSEDIYNYASMEGIYMEIKDSNNSTLCYSGNSNRPSQGMMGHMMRGHGMMNRHFNNMGSYVEKTLPLFNKDEIIGSLIIGYIDNSYLTESALIFKDTLTSSFLLSGIITVSLGFIISILLAKGLTSPLLTITNTANQMRKGNLKSRSIVKTNTKEIIELSHSINYLGETLIKQEDLRKRYASDISHELRTPLTTLKSHVEAMVDGVWEPSKTHLTILMEEIDRLTKLVEDLKNTFKTLEGQLNVNKTTFNISNELENIVAGFQPLFHKNNYRLESSLEENIIISMDKDRLKQIIYNLLSNAMKYLKDEGKVMIRLSSKKDHIKIIVEDNGLGMKEEDLPYIFERFYRADISRNKKTGGTGLGLSITQSLIEAHGGTIMVDSKYNKGTKFTIILPY